MLQENTLTPKRIESIDVLRGIVMLIMALDHTRDYFHIAANTTNPLDLVNLNTPLFFTRWITHFCAPIFVFLSGTSIYLQSLRKTKQQLSIFVMKRGLWLILVEFTIVAFAWTFNPYFTIFPLQVIWAIGISMVLLGLLLFINIPYQILLLLGVVIVLGHNALDFIEASKGFKPNFWWDLLHTGSFTFYPIWGNHAALVIYPFLPWTGLMIMGYCIGKIFDYKFSAQQRTKQLKIGGLVLLATFIVLRLINLYGDPVKWVVQESFFKTLLSFINLHKYPPSLLFMCLTIGTGLMALSFLERLNNKLTAILKVYGSTAFVYYVLHLYLIHFIAVIFYFIHGNTLSNVWNIGKNFPFLFVVPGQGESLLVVYLIWLSIIAILYPVCKRFNQYKTKHKEKWWLHYL